MSRQIICSNCGSVVPLGLYFSQSSLAKRIRTQSLCFNCAFWMDYKENPRPDTAIINGKLYTFQSHEETLWNKWQRKKRGIVFAQNISTGTFVYAFNVRRIADVPVNFRKEFPDQYHFVSLETYAIAAERACRDCLAKGCWDRYNCFWYNRQKAEPGKPWNKIPSYHKVGDEKCESFVNKETMYNINLQD